MENSFEIYLDYEQFRTIILFKNILWQYISDAARYTIFAIDGNVKYNTNVVIDPVLVPGCDPVLEAARKLDFETNYKPTANQRISPIISITGTTVSEIYAGDNGPASVVTNGDVKELRVKDADSKLTLDNILIQLGGSVTTILKQAEFTFSTRTETDVTGVTYTVPANKNFKLIFFGSSVDSPANAIVRLKVNNVTQFRFDIGGGQGMKVNDFTIPNGVLLATAGQTVKVTIEPQYSKGTIWAGFSGLEI